MFAILLMFMTSTQVSAKQVQRYTVEIPPFSTAVNLPWVTAYENDRYAVNAVDSSTGNPNIHSYYQTNYNGSAVTVGGQLTMPGAGYTYDVAWKPRNYQTNPAGYNIYASGTCSASNGTVNDNWCFIQGGEYRLRMVNAHIFSTLYVTGHMDWTN